MPVELPHLAMRTAPVHDYVYFTGGLVGIQFVEGWGLVPTKEDGKPHAIGPLEMPQLLQISKEANCGLAGFNQVVKTGDAIPFESWQPAVAWQRKHLSGADSWDLISTQFHESDPTYARFASNLADCLKAAGARVRDASNSQLTQLKWALRNGIEVGTRFTNPATYSIYLALRAQCSELRATRTALLRLIGFQCGLSPASESLEELLSTAEASKTPLEDEEVLRVISEAAAWLDAVGETFDRSLPNSASICLRLNEVMTSAGAIIKLQVLGRNHAEEGSPIVEPAIDLLDDYNRLEALCQRIAKISGHLPSTGEVFLRRRHLQKFRVAVLPEP